MTERNPRTDRARSLRRTETKTEKLLWSVLRGKQVCGLKFRRQHSIGQCYVDFACVSQKLVVEIDGGYHDEVGEADLRREAIIRQEGWDIIRFSDRDVEDDPEAVAIGIAKHLGLKYEYRKRAATGSGMESVKAPNKRSEGTPPRPLPRPTLPEGGCPQ
jgi:leucyl-tRNA synthetase